MNSCPYLRCLFRAAGWPWIVAMAIVCAAGSLALPTSNATAQEPSLDAKEWLAQWRWPEENARDWHSRFGDVWGGWFGPENDECAQQYITNWGPLGIRTRMLDRTWANYSAFRKLFPKELCSTDGQLVVNAFEVLAVHPGSPADGHLHVGDFLIRADGELFLSGVELRGEPQLELQGTRSLELHAGRLLDKAEGRGKIDFMILRPPVWKTVSTSPRLNTAGGTFDFDIDVAGAREVRLIVEAGGSQNFDWANWLRPTAVLGDGKRVDLSEASMKEATAGWGKVRRSIQANDDPVTENGKAVPESIGTHANSVIRIAVPDGAVRFQVTLQAPSGKGDGILGKLDVLPGMKFVQPKPGWEMVAEQSMMDNAARQQGLPLDFPVKGGQQVRLSVSDGGNGNGSDGFDWKGLILESEGGQVLPVSELLVRERTTGWANIKISNNGKDWWVHANSVIVFDVPPGDWRVRGHGSASGGGTVIASAESRTVPVLSSSLAEWRKEVSIPLPRFGSFDPKAPLGGEKIANIVATQAAWLASRQRDDGSWERVNGYTSAHYDTAWAMLGLMATGDKSFDPQIHKAAEWLAFAGVTDNWAVPESVVLLALSEYWLRYRDNRFLPAIEVRMNRLLGSSLQSDWTAGHGHVPGYTGNGVSIGGSHLCLALAVANLTPVKPPEGIVANMLARAQELAPDGRIPYGRSTGTRSFQPSLEGGATYNGRQGPYLLGSYVAGGPRIFSENCAALYRDGGMGGLDLGHATQTLSTTWGLIAAGRISEATWRKQLDAHIWKITMLRCYSGGFAHNSYNIEYQGGEGLLSYALRGGGWLVALNAPKKNLAMTGLPAYQAKDFTDVSPTSHMDAMVHGYYLRNWAVAEAALGGRAPQRLREGVATLQKMNLGEGTAQRVFEFLKSEAPPLAREIVAMTEVENTLRHSVAEMILGIDHRISVAPARKDGQEVPGEWQIEVTTQHAFAGYGGCLNNEQRNAYASALPLPMLGEVVFEDPEQRLQSPIRFPIEPTAHVNFNGWHDRGQKATVTGMSEPFTVDARIHFTAGDIAFDYTRPIHFGAGETWGSGEKGRDVTNDRRVWVPGTLLADHTRFNLAFRLPSGIRIAAATQGGDVAVRTGEASAPEWFSPRDRYLTVGAECDFCFTSGWQHFEARVPEVRLRREGASPLPLAGVSGDAAAADIASLTDHDRTTACPVAWTENEATFEIQLDQPRQIRAMELRLTDPHHIDRVVIEAKVENEWQTIWWGRPYDFMIHPVPVKTATLRAKLTRSSERPPIPINTWHVYE